MTDEQFYEIHRRAVQRHIFACGHGLNSSKPEERFTSCPDCWKHLKFVIHQVLEADPQARREDEERIERDRKQILRGKTLE